MLERSTIRVLVVDDEFPVRVSLGGYLEDRDFDVLLSAESAEETLGILKSEHVDCIIVDIRLPNMDGNELILKAHAIRPASKFLIHTGSTDYQVPPSLIEIGITNDDVFYKPVADMSVIAEAIQRRVQEEDR